MNPLILQNDFRKAVDQGALEVHYQPIIGLHDGRVSGFEALARWPHPEQGMISPGVFIPLADELGLAAEVGLWVLRRACRQVRTWQNRVGPESLSPSVNISPRQLERTGAADEIAAVITETGFDPQHLVLEILEGLLQDETAIANLETLRDLGFQILIDDFGLESDSPAHFRRAPVDAIKIDRSLVRDVNENPETIELVRAMITTAETLGMPVFALAVETEEELDRLRSLRCDHAQGWLFSRPLTSQGAMDYLAQPEDSTGAFALSS